jgi:hypothetical protein
LHQKETETDDLLQLGQAFFSDQVLGLAVSQDLRMKVFAE